MILKDTFPDLTDEESAHLDLYSREIDKLTSAGPRVLSEVEISRLASSLEKIIEEVTQRGRQQTDKVNT